MIAALIAMGLFRIELADQFLPNQSSSSLFNNFSEPVDRQAVLILFNCRLGMHDGPKVAMLGDQLVITQEPC